MRTICHLVRNININYPAFKVVAMYHPPVIGWGIYLTSAPRPHTGMMLCFGHTVGPISRLSVVCFYFSDNHYRSLSLLPSTLQWWPNNPTQSLNILRIPSVKTWSFLMDPLSFCHHKQTAYPLMCELLQGREVHSTSSTFFFVASKSIIPPPSCGIPYFFFPTGIHWISL